MGLLESRQRFFVDKLSQLVIRESDIEVVGTSTDEELSDVESNVNHFVANMVKSEDRVDKRFINMYRIRSALEVKHRIGRAAILEVKDHELLDGLDGEEATPRLQQLQ